MIVKRTENTTETITSNGQQRSGLELAHTQEGHTNHVSHKRYFQQFPSDSLFAEIEVSE